MLGEFIQFLLISARPSMSSANHILVMTLSQTLMVPAWSSRASVLSLSKKMLKGFGESWYPWLTPVDVQNHSPNLSLLMTALLVSL